MLDLNSEEKFVVDTVRRFAAEQLSPAAAEIDDRAEFVHRHRPGLAALGLMGLNLPEAYGGAGVSALALMASVEAVAGACGSTASMLTAHYLATDSILIGGGEEQKQRYLPRAATGDLLGAFALTEPRAGSNPADMSSRAIRVDAGYRLTGSKQFISNGGVADFIVVYAVTDAEAGHRGISAFIVDRDQEGVSAGRPERTMGLKGGHVFELAFDVEIPESARLGDEGTGFRTAMKTLDNGRVEVAAMCIGIAQAALDASLDWARERIVGGQALSGYQGIQWMLADMSTDLEAARALAERAASLRAAGERFTSEASYAKLFASEMAFRVTDKALQIHGGYGYTREFPLERYARDVRIMRIYEGSSEVQRNIIARSLLSSRGR